MKKLILLSLLLLSVFQYAKAQKLDRVQGEILVQMKPGTDPLPLVRQLASWQGRPTRLEVKAELSAPMRIWLLGFDFANVHEVDFLQNLSRRREVEHAQFNHILQYRQTVPDDPSFNQQWQWVNTGQNSGTPDADVDADLAWDLSTGGMTAGGDEIVVCVVEGANRNHPDLQGNLWFNLAEIPGNGIDDDGNGYTDDYNGWNSVTDNDNIPSENHGTFVSGMIGAVGNNGVQTTGINWNVKIMHVEIGNLTEANVVKAYTYPWLMRKRYNESCGAQGAFVVATNSSWGIDNGNASNSPLWCAFYDSLGQVGILSCASTTNNNVNVDVVGDLPTGCESEYMISVTASNRNDVRTFSGYGTKHVDLAAPGESVYSIRANGNPGSSSGTSFASPLTAGVVALLYSAACSDISALALGDPAAAALRIRDYIFEGVDVKPNFIDEVKTGGRVNAFNSMQLLLADCGTCPKPSCVAARSVTDTSAVLTWESEFAVSTNLRWRIAGNPDWTVWEDTLGPVSLTGLLSCTTYEFQTEAYCSLDSSGYSASVFFTTDGCCVAPAALSVNSVTDSSAKVAWDFVLAANAYNLRLNTPAGPMIFSDLQDLSLELNNLEPCTEYSLQVQTSCDTGATEYSAPVEFKTFGCGVCLDLTYCPISAQSSANEWIQNVTIAGLNNSSGGGQGYDDFTGSNATTDLATYKGYPITLTPGYSGNNWNEWWVVWLDLNADGDFLDTGEEVYDSGAAFNIPVDGIVVIPGNAKPGLTRMRVAMRFNAKPTASCLSFNFGEVEDYCVNIVESLPPDCRIPDSLEVTGTDYNGIALVWEQVQDAFRYEMRYRKVGDVAWSSLLINGASAAEVLNLTDCTEYEFQVRSICVGIESDWSSLTQGTTECFPACTDLPLGLDTVEVGENFASFTWEGTANATSYRLRFKKPSDAVWATIQTPQTNYLLVGLTPCQEYQYSLQAICPGGESDTTEIKTFKTDCTTASNDVGSDLQALLVRPNPFTAALWVDFSVLKGGKVNVEVFDTRGRKLFHREQVLPAGFHRWQLDDDSAQLLPGVYFVKIKTGNGFGVRRVVKR
jgi:hypothetical protein